MEPLVRLIVLALAAHYVTYVVTDSELFRIPRRALARVPFVSSIVSCYNCAGFWSGLFVLGVWLLGGHWFVYVCALATSVQFLYQLREKSLP